jgi:hypothetical protein
VSAVIRCEPRYLTGFATFVVPALDDEDRTHLLAALGHPHGLQLPSSDPWAPAREHELRMLLSVVGGGRLLADHVAAQQDGAWAARDWFQCPLGYLDLLAALEDEACFVREVRRLGCHLNVPSDLRLWLAATGWRRLDVARDAIMHARSRQQVDALARVLARVEAPEMALPMLEIMRAAKASGIAKQWFLAHPLHTALGLTPLAMGRGSLAESARGQLVCLRRAGKEPMLAAALPHLAPEQAAWLQREILCVSDEDPPEISAAQLPGELRAAFAAVKPSLPRNWLSASELPPILVGGQRLALEEIRRVLRALAGKPRDAAAPAANALITQLKAHADAQSLDAFAWRLFELWQDAGAVSRDRWALLALGHLGGDGCVDRLPALIRAWPGDGHHARSVAGLSCLRTIGSTAALMALAAMIKKPGYRSLKPKAQMLLWDAARERGLSADELGDRIVPRCGLDEHGSRVLDLGSRSFRFVLDASQKPRLREAGGRNRADLPVRGAADDPDMHEAAVAEWKTLRKSLREVLHEQTDRLEDALTSGRSWTPAELETCFVRHPVMAHLVRGLVFAVCAGPGVVGQTFRVTEDPAYTDENDTAITLPQDVRIRVAHPAHLDEALKAAWGQLFGDYLIVPPFAQLNREIHRPGLEELQGTEIRRFRETRVSSRLLYNTLESRHWLRNPLREEGPASQRGRFFQHSKHFPHAGVRAFVRYSKGFHSSYSGRTPAYDAPQEIETIYFVPERIAQPLLEDLIRIADVDPAAVSEVLLLGHLLAGPT